MIGFQGALPSYCTLQGNRSPVTFTANLRGDSRRWGSRKGPEVWPSKHEYGHGLFSQAQKCLEHPGTAKLPVSNLTHPTC